MVRPRPRLILSSFLLTVLTAATLTAAPATAAQPRCAPPMPSTTRPGYTVADPRCDFPEGQPFTALTDAAGRPISEVRTEIRGGAATRIEVPLDWDGDLVLWAHGYRGDGTTVWVDSPPLRQHHIQQGFAWAASSYQTNGYDVGQGVRDTHALIQRFTQVTGRKPRAVYLTGASMGGHITTVTIEHHRDAYAGAMPTCGVLGDTELFDFLTDVAVTAAALTDTPIEFPLEPTPDFQETYVRQVLAMLPELGRGFVSGDPPTLTPLGRQWAAAVQQRSGGVRPGFASAFGFWNSIGSLEPLTQVPFLFGLYPGLNGGTVGIAPGNVVDNTDTVYQLDAAPALTDAERALNREVLRVEATAEASDDLTGIPEVDGDPRIPVLSLHTIGDLFVPFSMEQIYAAEAEANGQADLVAVRAIRGADHCDFTAAELAQGFDDLVTWVRTGKPAAEDPILDPKAVAAPTFGCRFTVGPHENFTAPACPT